MASRAGISSCDLNCSFWFSTFIILGHLITSLDTEVSILPRRKWMHSEIQITLDMTTMQWWIALMFPPPLNPLKGGIGFYLIRTFIPLLNCFISYYSEKSQMRSILALPPCSPSAHPRHSPIFRSFKVAQQQKHYSGSWGGNLLVGFTVPAAEETELGKAHHAQGSHSGEQDTDTILPKWQHLTSYLHIPFWMLWSRRQSVFRGCQFTSWEFWVLESRGKKPLLKFSLSSMFFVALKKRIRTNWKSKP